jgi:hypothetical protein
MKDRGQEEFQIARSMEGTMTGLNLHQLKNEAEKRVQRGELKIAH